MHVKLLLATIILFVIFHLIMSTSPPASSDEDIVLSIPILEEDIGKLIGPGGKQSTFIRKQSRLKTFSICDRKFTAYGHDWVNCYVRGDRRAVQLCCLLIKSTTKHYHERALGKTKDQLESALHRIQELEEKLGDMEI